METCRKKQALRKKKYLLGFHEVWSFQYSKQPPEILHYSLPRYYLKDHSWADYFKQLSQFQLMPDCAEINLNIVGPQKKVRIWMSGF